MNENERKEVAKYLADYVCTEVDSSLKITGFGAWDKGNMQEWLLAGLKAYEATHEG